MEPSWEKVNAMSDYHKQYSKEFKEEAVRLLLTGNKTPAGFPSHENSCGRFRLVPLGNPPSPRLWRDKTGVFSLFGVVEWRHNELWLAGFASTGFEATRG
jgi:hypothetical protein